VLRRLVVGALVAGAASLAACIDASRVNASCRWTEGSVGKLDLSRPPDREHLRQDAQVAWEVGQRYADVRYRTNPRLARPLLDSCRAAMYDSIVARHGVTLSDVEGATHARAWSVDIAFVFLPMLVATVIAMDAIARRIRRSPRSKNERRIELAALVGFVALIAAALTQMWAMILESWRLRNEHIAGRAFVVPSVAHPAFTFAALCVVAAIVAMWRSARGPGFGMGPYSADH